LLAAELQVPFFDADDYHPKDNIEKMSKGIPLNDEDRQPWLVSLNELAKAQLEKTTCIIACSALKKRYRTTLQAGIQDQVKWVFLDGSYDQIRERMEQRKDHFMPEALLQSQFDALESPEGAIRINIKNEPIAIIEMIKEEIQEKSEFGLFGLGVMGKSLSRNIADKGFRLSLFNRHLDNVEENVAQNFVQSFEELATAKPFDDIKEFVASIQQPRKIMLMVNAGKTIDIVIETLLPHLSPGDCLIDGGNANFNQTNDAPISARREADIL